MFSICCFAYASTLLRWCLQADSGVSMGQFLVYCKLMRAGFVAHRNGIPWVQKYSEVLRKRGFRLAAGGGINDGLTEGTGEKSAAAYSMRKKRKRKACGGEDSRSWWPEYTYFSAEEESKVPRCVIVTQDMLIESRLQEFPNLRPIRMYSESDLENDSKDISGHDLLVRFFLLLSLVVEEKGLTLLCKSITLDMSFSTSLHVCCFAVFGCLSTEQQL